MGADERVMRVRRSHLRQELLAPAAALAGWSDLLCEEARGRGRVDLLDDLARIRDAAWSLHDWIAALLEGERGDGTIVPDARLRHDLRTPLNAIKGYAELMLEEGGGLRAGSLRPDIRHVLAEADRLLAAIDAIVRFGGAGGTADEPAMPDAISGLYTAFDGASRTWRETGRILVVDDNASNRDLMVRLLARDGHAASAAASGGEALHRLRAEPVDLILLDLVLPDIDGFRMLRLLKEDSGLRDIPVLIVSGIDEIGSAIRCIEAGAEDYLRKPVSATLMRARIEASLERKRWRDRERDYLARLESEKRRAEGLLHNILPVGVAERLNRGETVVADRMEAVTVLFADLVGFTALSARLPAGEIVAMLNRVYTEFDALTRRCGGEKIKTLGDAYMAAAGLPDPCPDHADRMADLALAMLPAVERLGRELGLPLGLRIGINSGPAVAGIIGTHKFSYDLWGDTVNVAARLEQHGTPGRIHVSQVTAGLLVPRYRTVHRGPIDIKGHGTVETCFLDGRRLA